MIQSKERSFWIGASDTKYVMGNWETVTFAQFWMEKLGIHKSSLQTRAMQVGTILEHRVLDKVPRVLTKDLQITFPELKLRVNYDGTGENYICEVKTHMKPFKVTKAYWMQAQVEMYAWLRKYGTLPEMDICAYQVTDDDYKNYFRPIDESRMEFFPVKYDPDFIKEYEQKLKHLKWCMERGVIA